MIKELVNMAFVAKTQGHNVSGVTLRNNTISVIIDDIRYSVSCESINKINALIYLLRSKLEQCLLNGCKIFDTKTIECDIIVS